MSSAIAVEATRGTVSALPLRVVEDFALVGRDGSFCRTCIRVSCICHVGHEVSLVFLEIRSGRNGPNRNKLKVTLCETRGVSDLSASVLSTASEGDAERIGEDGLLSEFCKVQINISNTSAWS